MVVETKGNTVNRMITVMRIADAVSFDSEDDDVSPPCLKRWCRRAHHTIHVMTTIKIGKVVMAINMSWKSLSMMQSVGNKDKSKEKKLKLPQNVKNISGNSIGYKVATFERTCTKVMTICQRDQDINDKGPKKDTIEKKKVQMHLVLRQQLFVQWFQTLSVDRRFQIAI